MSGHDVDDYLSDLLGAPAPAPKPPVPAAATPAAAAAASPGPEAETPSPVAEPNAVVAPPAADTAPPPAAETVASEPTPAPPKAVERPIVAPPSDPSMISEDEFEALLDQLHGGAVPGSAPVAAAPPSPPPKPPANPEEISEDEFEALLDNLHGGAVPGSVPVVVPSAVASKPSSNPDEISEDEFEALLNQLHGDGAPGTKAPAVTHSGPDRRGQPDRRQRDDAPPEGVDRRSDGTWRGDDRRASHRSSRWLRIRVHEQDYAVELLRVQEVLLPVPVLAMRDTDVSMVGVMNLRGVVVPVIDLGVWLGLEEVADDPQVRFVVLEHNGDTIALRVTAVLDVHAIVDSQIEPAENTLTGGGDTTLRGVTRIHAAPVILLEASGLLN